jgi:hypothetical protein
LTRPAFTVTHRGTGIPLATIGGGTGASKATSVTGFGRGSGIAASAVAKAVKESPVMSVARMRKVEPFTRRRIARPDPVPLMENR